MRFEEHVPLADLTTFRVGGPARYLCRPGSAEDLRAAFRFAADHRLEVFRLGHGSNVLISDQGFAGLVILTSGLAHLRFEGSGVDCGAGIKVTELCRAAAGQGLSGLEFAGGLPGSLGGAVFMNARAYGGSFSDVVRSVRAMTPQGTVRDLDAQDLQYAYKRSSLMDGEDIVFQVSLQLHQGDRAEIMRQTEENEHKRREQGQYSFPNAGCIFKNNYQVGIPSGKLIDQLGLLGTRVGDAQVFEKHGNFIVNLGAASAEDIRSLIHLIKERVATELGVQLEEEVRYVGFDRPVSS